MPAGAFDRVSGSVSCRGLAHALAAVGSGPPAPAGPRAYPPRRTAAASRTIVWHRISVGEASGEGGWREKRVMRGRVRGRTLSGRVGLFCVVMVYTSSQDTSERDCNDRHNRAWDVHEATQFGNAELNHRRNELVASAVGVRSNSCAMKCTGDGTWCGQGCHESQRCESCEMRDSVGESTRLRTKPTLSARLFVCARLCARAVAIARRGHRTPGPGQELSPAEARESTLQQATARCAASPGRRLR